MNHPHVIAPANARARSVELDFLRGLAVLFVLFRHPVITADKSGGLVKIASLTERFGWTGVDLFFVLSGFLVGGLLFKEIKTQNTLDMRRFWLRRGLKIWPSYYVFLGVATIQFLRHSTQPAGTLVWQVVPNLFHIQNYSGTPFGITWTLAVEEHFYLLLPLVLLLIIRLSKRPIGETNTVPYVAVGLMVLCTSLRCMINLNKPFDFFTHVAYTHLRIDSLFWGVFLSYCYHFRPRYTRIFARHPIAWISASCIMILPMALLPLTSPFVWTVGFTLLYLGYGFICMTLVCASEGRPFFQRLFHHPAAKAVAFVGVYSYSIYLWHANTALDFLGFRLNRAPFDRVPDTFLWLFGMMSYVCLAVGVGFVMAKLIEMPMLKLRNRLLPARSTALNDPETPEVKAGIL